MKIEKRKMVFNKGTAEEEERQMIILDKERYEIHVVTEQDIGKTFRIVKSPIYLTMEQFEEIKKFRPIP